MSAMRTAFEFDRPASSLVLTELVAAGVREGAGAAPMFFGNETKIDLSTGVLRRVVPGQPDSVIVLDFSKCPPLVTHWIDIPNPVIGPPSKLA